MTPNTSSLELSRLEKVRQRGGKIIARCPACAEHGGDRKAVHLAIFPSGAFVCAAFPGDKEHNSRISALVGLQGGRARDTDEERLWRQRVTAEQRQAQESQRLLATIRQKRQKLIARHEWDDVHVWEDSPQRIDSGRLELDPRHFLASLFPANALVWSGDVRHSGTRHARHWRTVAEWQDAPSEEIGPMTAPAVWMPGTCNRTAVNVHVTAYTILDFDGFDGHTPEKAGEIEEHRRNSLALVRWIREGLQWQLAAIVWTGSKSIHAWFHTPPPDVLHSLRETAAALGIDAGLIGRPEHPCRLPGQRHAKTGGMSRVLWLQEPTV